MYEELIKNLREDSEWAHANEWETPITLGNNLDTAVNAIETLERLAQNGQSAIDTNRRLADKIRMLQAELNRLKRERDQAVKDLHHNNACEICIGFNEQECCDCECLDCTLECRCKNCRDENLWQWRGVQEENNATG